MKIDQFSEIVSVEWHDMYDEDLIFFPNTLVCQVTQR